MLLFLISGHCHGQKLKINFGVGFTIYEEIGLPASVNGVEVILIPNDNFRGEDFAPNLMVHTSLNYKLNDKISLRYKVEYLRILSSFGALENSLVFAPLKVGVFKTPYLTNTVALDFQIVEFNRGSGGLNIGLIHQKLLKKRFEEYEPSQLKDERAFEMLNQAPKGIKKSNLLYEYGFFINFKKVRVSLNHQRHFDDTFTSSFEFERQEINLKSNRKFYSLNLEFTVFEPTKTKN